MSFRQTFTCCLLASLLWVGSASESAEAQSRTRRNFYGMHNLKDGGTSIPEGMKRVDTSSIGCGETTAAGSWMRWTGASFHVFGFRTVTEDATLIPDTRRSLRASFENTWRHIGPNM